MKTMIRLFSWALVIGASWSLEAKPAPPGALGLEVKMTQPIQGIARPYVTTWGSYNKIYTSQRALNVKLKLIGDFDREITVRWAFVAQRIARDEVYVHDSGSHEVEILRGGTEIDIISKVLTGDDLNLKAINQRTTSGGNAYGYALVVSQNGRVLGSHESSAGLIELLNAIPPPKPPRRSSR